MKKILSLVVIIALGAGAYWMFGGSHQGGEGGMRPEEVSIVRLERSTVDVSEEFPGRTSAYAVSEIRPQVSGIVLKRSFTEGSRVSKGQQLYQIDPAPFQATYNSAKASLVKAQAIVKSTKAKATRYKDLVKIEAISKQEYDDTVATAAQAEADVAVAQAALEQAKINLDYTKVYAPIEGRISKSAVTEGALVQAGQTQALATITQLHPIYVDITQSSEDMQRLRSVLKGKSEQKVTLLYKNATEYAEKGTLQFTDITVDPSTNAVAIRALFPNPEGDLLPGMFVRAKLDMTQENALRVPQKAASRAADGTLNVWVVGNDDTVQPAAITAERTVGDQWLVSAGVDAGDRIVLEGGQKLQPGAKVSISTSAGAAAPAAEPHSGE